MSYTSQNVNQVHVVQDVLFHSTNLYIQLSGALVQYASYGEQIRAHFKSIRARERRLRDMRGRRTSVANRTDAVEKGLTKVKSSVSATLHQSYYRS